MDLFQLFEDHVLSRILARYELIGASNSPATATNKQSNTAHLLSTPHSDIAINAFHLKSH